MAGYETYLRFQRIEEQAKMLGFRLANSKYGSGYSNHEMVALYPTGEELPVYARDAEIWCGTFDQIEQFLTGWAKAQQYDLLLRLTDAKKRKRYEAKELERQELMRKRQEQKKIFEILSDKSECGKSI